MATGLEPIWTHTSLAAPGLLYSNASTSQTNICCRSIANVLQGVVHIASDNEYTESILSYYSGQERDLFPSCIVKPRDSGEVSSILKVISSLEDGSPGACRFAVRGGGHASPAGSANIAAGVTIDLRSINQVKVNKHRNSTSIGGGALWGEVYAKLETMDLAVVGGRMSSVSIGGLATGGGISFFSPRFGFVCDNVLEYEIVLANGTILDVDPVNHPELMLALRGGSNNFGIVTGFSLKTFSQADLWGGNIIYDITAAPEQLQAFAEFGANPDYDEYSALIQVFMYNSATRGLAILNNPVYTKPVANPFVFRRFTQMKSQIRSDMKLARLSTLTSSESINKTIGRRNAMWTTTFVNDLELLHFAFNSWREFASSLGTVKEMRAFMLNQFIVPEVIRKSRLNGGNSLGLDSLESSLVISLLPLTWESSVDDKLVLDSATRLIDTIESEARSRGLYNKFKYMNYADSSQPVLDGYGHAIKERLRKVSQMYDPLKLFQNAMPGSFKLFL